MGEFSGSIQPYGRHCLVRVFQVLVQLTSELTSELASPGSFHENLPKASVRLVKRDPAGMHGAPNIGT